METKEKWEGWLVSVVVRPNWMETYGAQREIGFSASRIVAKGEILADVLKDLRYGVLMAAGEEILGR